MPSQVNIELAWAAGFFDGEGNIRWRPNNLNAQSPRTRSHGTFTLQIAQLDRGVLDRFHAAVGCGKVYGPYVRHFVDRPNMTYHTYSANGAQGRQAFALIRPYLSHIKIEQGDSAAAKHQEQCERPHLGNGHLRKKELTGFGVAA